jgi:coatomer subunit beta
LRKSITEKLLETFGQIRSGKVFRGALWIVGEYVTELEGACYFVCTEFVVMLVSDIQDTIQEIRKVIGEIPILASEQVNTSAELLPRIAAFLTRLCSDYWMKPVAGKM